VVILVIFGATVLYFKCNPPEFHSKIVYVDQKNNDFYNRPSITDAGNVTYAVQGRVTEAQWNKLKQGTAYLMTVSNANEIDRIVTESLEYPDDTKQISVDTRLIL
jgi:PKD repeat protein